MDTKLASRLNLLNQCDARLNLLNPRAIARNGRSMEGRAAGTPLNGLQSGV
jgi:hypothetical protein